MRRAPTALPTLVALLVMALLLYRERQIPNLAWHIGGFLLGLFVVCMFCHGELARSRPAPSRLTHFYLAVSAGGVAGGALVALGAPALLPGYFEVEIGLVLLAVAVGWRSWHAGAAWRAAALVVLVASAATTVWRVQDTQRQVIEISRNFYGVLRIRDHAADEPANHERVMIHGRILHGQQFLAPERRRQPTSYYTRRPASAGCCVRWPTGRSQVGAVGLGAGTIATYGKPGDHYRFYEIDPAIVEAAQRSLQLPRRFAGHGGGARRRRAAAAAGAKRRRAWTWWWSMRFRAMRSPPTCSRARPWHCTASA